METVIARRLAALDRSASWLARQTGVHRSTASRWARGELVVGPQYRAAIAEALDMPVGELFPDNPEVNE